jgi:hypothetical protein
MLFDAMILPLVCNRGILTDLINILQDRGMNKIYFLTQVSSKRQWPTMPGAILVILNGDSTNWLASQKRLLCDLQIYALH